MAGITCHLSSPALLLGSRTPSGKSLAVWPFPFPLHLSYTMSGQKGCACSLTVQSFFVCKRDEAHIHTDSSSRLCSVVSTRSLANGATSRKRPFLSASSDTTALSASFRPLAHLAHHLTAVNERSFSFHSRRSSSDDGRATLCLTVAAGEVPPSISRQTPQEESGQ